MTIAVTSATRQLHHVVRTSVRGASFLHRKVPSLAAAPLVDGIKIQPNDVSRHGTLSQTNGLSIQFWQSYSTRAKLQAEHNAPKPRVSQVSMNSYTSMLETQWSDGNKTVFPYVFLRDNCRCEKCYLPPSKSRVLLLRNLDIDTCPEDVKVDSHSGNVEITWDDGHVSFYPSDWLWTRRFGPEGLKERQKWLPLEPVKWNRDYIEDNLPQYEFSKLINDGESLYNWICDLETLGFALITGTPCERGMVRKLADRVAYLRNTNYGPIWYEENKVEPSNAAYTTLPLGLTTDLAFFSYTPGVQMLHCIKQVPTKGGAKQFADGFYVADLLRTEKPDYFETLCKVPVDFSDLGTDFVKFHKLNRVPTFRLSRSGRVTSVMFNQQHRDSFLTLDVEQIKPLYDALRYYEDLLNQPENQIVYKLRPGDFVCFHNHRVLHGRESFEILGGGERTLEGGYLDWDELYSRRRVLQADLAAT